MSVYGTDLKELQRRAARKLLRHEGVCAERHGRTVPLQRSERQIDDRAAGALRQNFPRTQAF